MVKWPFQGLSDLQPRDNKVTLNHLEPGCFWLYNILPNGDESGGILFKKTQKKSTKTNTKNAKLPPNIRFFEQNRQKIPNRWVKLAVRKTSSPPKKQPNHAPSNLECFLIALPRHLGSRRAGGSTTTWRTPHHAEGKGGPTHRGKGRSRLTPED